MNDKQKIGGIAALVGSATIVVGLAMFATLLSDFTSGDSDPAESVAFIADNYATLYIWNLVVMVVFGIILVPLTLALHDRLRVGADVPAQMATVFGLIWATLLIGAGMVTVMDLGTVADAVDTRPGDAEAIWLTLDSVERGLGGTIEIVGGLWVLLTSVAALRAGVFPKALNYVGVVMSVAAFLTVVPALELVGAVFGLGLIVWLGWMGVDMMRSGETAPA